MNTVDLFRQLLPPVSYDTRGENLSAELQAEANVMDDVRASEDRVLASITPFHSTFTLSDFERIYDIVPHPRATIQERRQDILARMAATGGLSIPYFINLAASLGYTITITEPRPFRAGVNRCGDMVWSASLRWVWIVNVIGSKTRRYYFRAGVSTAGEPLLSFGELTLETLFHELKPAFTECYFTYQDPEVN